MVDRPSGQEGHCLLARSASQHACQPPYFGKEKLPLREANLQAAPIGDGLNVPGRRLQSNFLVFGIRRLSNSKQSPPRLEQV